MANLYEKYKKKEAEYYNRFNDLLDRYDERYRATGDKSIKSLRNSLNSTFTSEHSTFKSYETNPNIPESQYIQHFQTLDMLFSEYEKHFNSKFNNGVNAFKMTKDEAKKCFNEKLAQLKSILQKLKEFNDNFKQRGKHMNNIRAVKAMDELNDKIMTYTNRFDELYKNPSANFPEFIKKVSESVDYYKRLSESILKDRQLYYSDRPDFGGSQPGE